MTKCTRCQRPIVIIHFYGDNERLCGRCFEQATQPAEATSSNTLIQQLTEELLTQTERSQMLEAQVRQLKVIVESLFEIAEPGPVKSSLWRVYQNVGKPKPFKESMEGISGI